LLWARRFLVIPVCDSVRQTFPVALLLSVRLWTCRVVPVTIWWLDIHEIVALRKLLSNSQTCIAVQRVVFCCFWGKSSKICCFRI
jgi:hypothetical protein